MSPSEAEREKWPPIAVQLLREIQEGRMAVAHLRTELNSKIGDVELGVKTEIATLKARSGIWGSISGAITAGIALGIAWATGTLRGG